MDYGKTTRVQDITTASAYQFWLPCQQASPDITVNDQSGNSADAVLGADLTSAEVWTNAGWATTKKSASNETFSVPVADISWDMAQGESFILSFWTDALDKTSVDGIFGTCDANGETGFRALIHTTGSLRGVGVGDDTAIIAYAAGYLGADLSAGVHHTVITVDGSAKTLSVWQDGVNLLDGFDVSAASGTTQPTQNLFFGSDSATNDSIGGQWRDIHFLVWAGGLPTNIGEIVNLLNTRPFYPLSQDEFPL